MTRFVVRSLVSSSLHEAVHRGEIPADLARQRLARINAMPQLEADALVTLDAVLARQVEGIVPTASIDALR